MNRSKNVVFLSHCILNQNTVVHPLARAKGSYQDIIKLLMDYGIGIHQLPCPEYRHLGLKRQAMDKQQYDTKEYRKLCKNTGEDTINIMKEYLENDYNIIGLIGVNHSPTCSIKGRQGILMKEILKLTKEENIQFNLIDIPEEYEDKANNSRFINECKELLLKNVKTKDVK